MATAPSNRRTGTGFVNLADWARANAGASNSLVDRLTGDVARDGRAVQNDLNRLGRQFDDESTAGGLEYLGPADTIGRADIYSQARYRGPRSLYDVGNPGEYDETLRRADAVEAAAGRAGDYFGRQGTLQGLFGQTGAYTPGQQRLDSALLGIAGKDRFAALQQQWGNLYGRAQQADADARRTAGEREAMTADAARRYGEDATRLRAEAAERERREMEEAGRVDDEIEARRRRQPRRTPTNPDDAYTPGGKGYLGGWA